MPQASAQLDQPARSSPIRLTEQRCPIPSDAPVLLGVEQLSLVYPEGVRALDGVSFELRAGERLVLLGASGSGKSSLLGCLTGRLKATSGRVRREGGIAIIHQDLRLVRQRSALSNVLHGVLGRCSLSSSLLGFPKAERARARALLERVGLKDRIHARVSRLSGGEQQRVAIARALMQNPRILLADEPVASLDEFHARQVMQLLDELCRERNLGLITVLHDCNLAERFSDRMMGLDRGRAVYDSRNTPGQRFDCQACRLIHDAAMQPAAGESGEPARPAWFKPAAFVGMVLLAVALYAWAVSGMKVDQRQLDGALPGLQRFASDLIPTTSAQWDRLAAVPWSRIFGSLIETIQMSILGTTLGVLISWPLAAMAARNVGPRLLCAPARLILNTIRTVPSLIWALLFVAAVGPGVLAGVLSLIAYSIGYLTKFFYEAFEAVEPGAPDALKELGAGGPKRFLHAVWPASRPAVLSSSMFMLEYNVRAASVLGVVGAGGIGYWIYQFVEWRNFPAVLVCLLMILVVVIALDALSTTIRSKLVRA